MSGYGKVIRESEERDGKSSSLSNNDYGSLHSEAKLKLIETQRGGAQFGKGIDVEVEQKGNKIPVEVTVLPSWKGNAFPFEELTVRQDRIKRPNQHFAYFNFDLDVMTIVRPSMLKVRDQNGNFRIQKEALKFQSI
ncbi:hypothetical protein ACFLWZ_04570 [Chloroflexota bacterium]